MSELDYSESPEQEITRLKKIIQVLMDRAEHGSNTDSSDFSLFQTTIALEEKVRQRTQELQQALDQLAHTNIKLAETNLELDHSLSELKSTQDQLVESKKMAALGALVAGVAHEINTPVGIGITATSLVTEEVKELKNLLANETLSRSNLDKFLSMIEDSSNLTIRNLQRVGKLVSNFKEVAVNQGSMKKQHCQINRCIENSTAMLTPKLSEAHVQLQLKLSDDVHCITYESAIDQIVTNLITNALDHAFSSSAPAAIAETESISADSAKTRQISISTQLNGHQFTLLFEDNGKGIAPELVERIFEPFYTTRRGSGGMGLGLHITYNLATEILGGSIQCTSQPGQGTQFKLCFPVEISTDTHQDSPNRQ
ncbi:sensor histidine kinase [Oceanospirillum beijerinckii]|uniref:sensor histidine kinase n=1 Tax=Oceanospirillum beijerinckii TaxID=64976 RepID=UPI0004036C20|nr:ATP-binding protein [Oceanospirillum beijerinckii]